MGIPSIGHASSGGSDNLQAAYSGAQASAQASQYPCGTPAAKVAPASGSAAQSREVQHG